MDLIYFNRCVEKQCFINWVIFNAGLETIFYLFFFSFLLFQYLWFHLHNISLFFCQYQFYLKVLFNLKDHMINVI